MALCARWPQILIYMYLHILGEYSCLKVDLLFKREFSYYLIQIYIPCCMLVIVSWVSFWLDQGAVPARVSLGLFSYKNICLLSEWNICLRSVYLQKYLSICISSSSTVFIYVWDISIHLLSNIHNQFLSGSTNTSAQNWNKRSRSSSFRLKRTYLITRNQERKGQTFFSKRKSTKK